MRGLRYDTALSLKAQRFFPLVLRLAGGEHEAKPFELIGWQAFVVGSLFGWLGPSGYRRFRVAYIETGKGSGKSPLVAGIGLYMLVADGEARAEVYAAATKRDQAAVLFRDAVAMVRQSPALSARLSFSGGAGREWNIADPKTWSFFRPISADQGQSGPRPSCGIIDELHEHPNGNAAGMLRAGTKSRKQALILSITNSGHDTTSFCFEQHQYSNEVSARVREDDSWFAYVCALDEGDDPLTDEACWPKANPSLTAGLPGYQYLREEVTQARGMPSAEARSRRLNFCQWTEAEQLLFSKDVWMAGQSTYRLEDFEGEECWAGLDLSFVSDLTVLVLVFKRDGLLWIWPFFWLPEEGLAQKSKEDRWEYAVHQRGGWLETTPGKTIDHGFVSRRLGEITARFRLKVLAYDRYKIEILTAHLRQEGIELPLQEHGQGTKGMGPAIDSLESALVNNGFRHNGNPIMTWCASNAVVEQDKTGARAFRKDRANGRIDGIVATAMAVHVATISDEGGSVYESRGLVML